MSIELKTELKLQVSDLISAAKLGILVLISAEAEIRFTTMNFSAIEIPSVGFHCN
jgi:hypothetical protein